MHENLAVEHFNFQIYHISVLVPSDGCRDLINWLTLISLPGITRKFKIKDFWILCTEMKHWNGSLYAFWIILGV